MKLEALCNAQKVKINFESIVEREYFVKLLLYAAEMRPSECAYALQATI